MGFEPTETCASAVFKTAAFDHSAIPPRAGAGPRWERTPADRTLQRSAWCVQYPSLSAERCWSGRSGLPAKQLSGVTWTAGSNPALSAIRLRFPHPTTAATPGHVRLRFPPPNHHRLRRDTSGFAFPHPTTTATPGHVVGFAFPHPTTTATPGHVRLRFSPPDHAVGLRASIVSHRRGLSLSRPTQRSRKPPGPGPRPGRSTRSFTRSCTASVQSPGPASGERLPGALGFGASRWKRVSYFVPPIFFSILAQLSRRVTVRLRTGCDGVESGSTQK